MNVVLLLLLLSFLVEVHPQQDFPYVSFMGQILANHSYVDLSLVGDVLSASNYSVQCHTDLGTCCNRTESFHRGDWYFPNGTRLPFSGGGDTYESHGYQSVDLHRTNNATSPAGIYRCDIATEAVHDNTSALVRDTPVYVGLYNASEGKQR